MTDFRDSRWADRLLADQHPDGKWGYFHSLSKPTKTNYITTEQALRRLQILGFTEKDAAIQKALGYMGTCLAGEDTIPDRVEKCHDWKAFTELMLSTWIRRFTRSNGEANAVALKWKYLITRSFQNGTFDFSDYTRAFTELYSRAPRGGRFIDPVNFYVVSILSDQLPHDIASSFISYILRYRYGIYYVYGKSLTLYPPIFESLETSRFIYVYELLSDYSALKGSDLFAPFIRWLRTNRSVDGTWDMGSSSKDGILLPLSDSWRKRERREADCTYRINRLLDRLL